MLRKIYYWFLKKYKVFSSTRYYSKMLNKEKKSSNYKISHLSKKQKDEVRAYWEKLGVSNIPIKWHEIYYAVTLNERVDYIPDPTFRSINKEKMNDDRFSGIWSDKCYLDKFISEKTPEAVIRNVNGRLLDRNFNLLSVNQAEIIMNQYETLVIKPSTFTKTGMGVKLLKKPYKLSALICEYKKNFIIQLPIKLHEDFKKLNKTSINTVRINSALLETEVIILSGFVKVGQDGEFADNAGRERYFIGIDSDGKYVNYAIDHDLRKYNEIPSGYCFAGKEVPFYKEICSAVIRAHKCIPHFGFAFWDVCVNEEGNPVIIEVNLRGPNVSIAQAASGPFMGDYTEKVMNFINRQDKDSSDV